MFSAGRKLGPAFGGESVEARFAIVFRDSPFCGDPTLVFKTLESKIQRPVVNKKSFVGLALNCARDPLAVVGTWGESLEDEKIQGTLE